ncbi:phage tail protein [Candidatus Gracilibacteria bacterium]|nr:phage tail protein [Candidatus Gracilibacteria bacterium]
MAVAKDAVAGDPLVGFNFGVLIEGGVSGYFTECSGLGSETEVIEHKVVGKDGKEFVRKIPGRLKWGDITLKRGITTSMDFWEWRKQVEDGKVDGARKDGSIIMYDQDGKEVARWNFEKAWPSKISGPSVKTDDNAVSVEELTIVHEYIKRVT